MVDIVQQKRVSKHDVEGIERAIGNLKKERVEATKQTKDLEGLVKSLAKQGEVAKVEKSLQSKPTKTPGTQGGFAKAPKEGGLGSGSPDEPLSPEQKKEIETKQRADSAKADLTQAKAEEQQIKTAATRQQAVQSGLAVRPNTQSQLAMKALEQAQAAALTHQDPREPAHGADLISNELQKFATKSGMSIDERELRKIGTFVTQQLERVRENSPFKGMVEAQTSLFIEGKALLDSKLARLAEIRSTEGSIGNIGERVLGGLTFGLLGDLTNDTEKAELIREIKSIRDNLFGVTNSTLRTSIQNRGQNARNFFNAAVQDFQRQKNVLNQLKLAGIKRKSESSKVEEKRKFDLAMLGQKSLIDSKLQEQKDNAALERAQLAASGKGGAPGPSEKQEVASRGGQHDWLRDYAKSIKDETGSVAIIANGVRSVMERTAAKDRSFTMKAVAAELIERIGDPALAIRSARLVSGKMDTALERSLLGQHGLPDFGFREEGVNLISSAGNLLLQQITDPMGEAVDKKVQVKLPDGSLVRPTNESQMIHKFLEDQNWVFIDDDPESSFEAIANRSDKVPVAVIRAATAQGVYGNGPALRRLAVDTIGRQIKQEDVRVAGARESAGFEGFIQRGLQTLRDKLVAQAARLKNIGIPEQFGNFGPSDPEQILVGLSPRAIISIIEKGVGLKKSLTVGDRFFGGDTVAVVPLLKKLGWTSIEALRKQMDKEFNKQIQGSSRKKK